MDKRLDLAATMVALGTPYKTVARVLGVEENEIRAYLAATEDTTQTIGVLDKDTEDAAVTGVTAAMRKLMQQAEEFYKRAATGTMRKNDLRSALQTLTRLRRVPNTIEYQAKSRAISRIIAGLNIVVEQHGDSVPMDMMVQIARVLNDFTPSVLVDTSRPVREIKIAFRRSPNRPNPVLNERGRRLLQQWRDAIANRQRS